jgi:hypothetical protein
LLPLLAERIAARERPHHLGLLRSSLTDQAGAPHARISGEATKRPFTRISDESTRPEAHPLFDHTFE